MSVYNSSLGILRIEEIMNRTKERCGRIHITGVLGAGQRGIAELLLAGGLRVSGSDRRDESEAGRLSALGLEFYPRHSSENVIGADLLIYTLAIDEENPEYAYARKSGIPCVSRAEFSAYLASRSEKSITVAGSHGKSTTTAMLAHIFKSAAALPTVLCGAELPCGNYSERGAGEFFIAEACEYKDSFLKFKPSVAIVNNIELDHTDYFGSIDALKRSFVKYANSASELALINCDDTEARSIIPKISTRVATFGAFSGADYRICNIAQGEGEFIFSLSKNGETLGEFTLKIPGVFNVSNAAAAIAAACECGLDIEAVRAALAGFTGIRRRLEYLGEYKARAVYYDYAHHPTEIYGVINALRTLGYDTVTVVFKPHTFSRTKDLYEGFVRSLSYADYVIIGDIYGAREENTASVSARSLAEKIGIGAHYSSDENVTKTLDNFTRGAIILMGAADFEEILKIMELKK